MQLMEPLVTDRLFFRPLTLPEVGDCYKDWLANPLVNQYLEIRRSVPDIAGLKSYVEKMNGSSENILLGIFLKSQEHIGNIKLGPVNWENKRGVIGLFIGDPASWNKGYATEAIRCITDYGLGELGLNRIEASCYESNAASYKAFIKAGYREEGRLRGYWNTETGFENHIMMGFLAEQ